MPTVNVHKIEQCFEMLERYSFVQWKKDLQSYSMHKLVHVWGHDRLPEDDFSPTARSITFLRSIALILDAL